MWGLWYQRHSLEIYSCNYECVKNTSIISRFFGTIDSPMCVWIDTETCKIDSDPTTALSTVICGHNPSALEAAGHEHDEHNLTGWKNRECSPKVSWSHE